MEFNADERKVLRDAEAMRELSETKGWRETFIPLLNDMISLREQIVATPLHDLPGEYSHLDYNQKVLLLEHIKGALIGLRLVRDLPQSLSTHARAIREDHSAIKEDGSSDV